MVGHGSGVVAGVRGARDSPHSLRHPTAPIAVLVVALSGACGPVGPPVAAEVVLSVGYAAPAEAGAATALDTLIDQLTREGLFRSGPNGRIEPLLAETWDVAPDGTAVTVVLRRDAAFHDGSPVTSYDVKASLDRIRVSGPRIARNPLLGDIESIATEGPRRVVIHLTRPSGQLLLFELGNRIEKMGADGRQITAGPFFEERRTEADATLRVNSHYYQGRSEIDAVRIKTYPTLRTAWAAMMRSEIDFLFNVPTEAREFVEADSNVQIFSRNAPFAYALLLNTRRPPFDDPRVRVALSHAVDREAIIEGPFRGHGSVASGIWSSHWVYDGVELTYDYDPLEADRQLNALGMLYPVSADQDSTEGFRSRLHFRTLVVLDQARFEPIALSVKRQLRQIGVEMEIDARPFAEVARQLRQSRHDSWDAVLLPLNTARNLGRLHTFWHSSQENAVTGFAGADDVLESLRSSGTEAGLSAAARAFQRVLFEQAPAIFLTNLEDARAVSRRFVVPEEPGREILETVWKWRVADQTPPH